ncbi:superoxide dismutase [Evansella sp. AB-P1]|uniref:superoxide dismutase n=1 Tax=Evansella sp. AB-P1 TaxID=3037653 RepID=UPI00241E7252|nr:superoxide dismutase [Evansella sp. AB-P1]MDG5787660.1 superoxide dismutase [Evansella sp. AB-P1]
MERQYSHDLMKWLEKFSNELKVNENVTRNSSDVVGKVEGLLHQLKERSYIDAAYLRQLEKEAEQLYYDYLKIKTSSGQRSALNESTSRIPIGSHSLPKLPYQYDSLEPYIHRRIMELHHKKHHQSYVDGLNKAEKNLQEQRKKNKFENIKHWERELAFHGAGHYLHSLFWQVLSPKGGGKPKGELANQIDLDFEGFHSFKNHFSEAANGVEGSGWAILVWSPRVGRLEILTAEKHQNLTQWDVIPLLPLDVWEHAYYLQYENERHRYVNNWWNIINWPYVEERYKTAKRNIWLP